MKTDTKTNKFISFLLVLTVMFGVFIAMPLTASVADHLVRFSIFTLDADRGNIISCATERKCDYFITTDNGLTSKNIERIKIINPIDFVRETEDLP